MPVAGNNVEALPLQVIDNTLHVGQKTRVASYMAVEAHQAIDMLQRGERVFLHLYGLNYVSVRDTLRKRGVSVENEG